MSDDKRWMNCALELAARGRGSVEPNPMVGAVVLGANGELVGEGWHRRFGEAHAEVNAFHMAGDQARGGTLFVTLEPCCHTGKTPPCTDAVLKSGVRRVVVAMADPFPKVAGGGIELLRRAGIEVVVGVCEAQSRKLNAPYLKLLSAGRPWVHLKWAMTLDGKIATRTGDSKWISGEQSRAIVHELRGRMDAILVGAGTVSADDPLLTARPPGPRTPIRVVVSARGNLPDRCQLRSTAREVPVLIFTAESSVPRLAGWANDGAEVIGLPTFTITDVLTELGNRRMTNVLVEGGAALFGSILDANLADEVHAFVAPTMIGGNAPSPVGGIGAGYLNEATKLEDVTVRMVGEDVYVNGRVKKRSFQLAEYTSHGQN